MAVEYCPNRPISGCLIGHIFAHLCAVFAGSAAQYRLRQRCVVAVDSVVKVVFVAISVSLRGNFDRILCYLCIASADRCVHPAISAEDRLAAVHKN